MSTSTPIARTITGIVLAGGRGMRVHGMDKGLIAYRGRPLAEQALNALRPQVDTLLISANRNLDRYREFGVAVIADHHPDQPGPLAGLAAGLRAATTEWLVSLPCDTTGVPDDTVRRLVDGAEAAGAFAAYARSADGPQYTVCALHRRLAEPLDIAIADGRRAVRDFLHAHDAVAVDFSDCVLENRNTPEAIAC